MPLLSSFSYSSLSPTSIPPSALLPITNKPYGFCGFDFEAPCSLTQFTYFVTFFHPFFSNFFFSSFLSAILSTVMKHMYVYYSVYKQYTVLFWHVIRVSDLVWITKEKIIPGWHRQTVLHRACLVGKVDIVKLLLDLGADPNARNNFDETPLHYACKRGLPPVVRCMLDKGGDVTLLDKLGKGVFHHAAEAGSVWVIDKVNTTDHIL